jgi:D-cysteine desulfhydrase
MTRPLFDAWPALSGRLETVALGAFPSPVERLDALERELKTGPLYVKRDDLSSPIYGGNKVRTLEVLFGDARARGAREILATGAFGSNHAVATVLHARAAGLEPGAILFPQPASWAALENLRVTLGTPAHIMVLPHWSFLPFAMWRARTKERVVMAPGGATPLGALGYVSAALELATQVRNKELEAPKRIYVGVGSTCTSAGLLVGFAHAVRLGIGFREPPEIVSVRVTPWPVTSRFRIVGLAVRASRLLAELTGTKALELQGAELSPKLTIDGAQIGPGYGRPSRPGLVALERFRGMGLFELDTTYSSKAAAGFLAGALSSPSVPHLFWSTKSTVPLPPIAPSDLASAPAVARRWMLRAERELKSRGLLPPSYRDLLETPEP